MAGVADRAASPTADAPLLRASESAADAVISAVVALPTDGDIHEMPALESVSNVNESRTTATEPPTKATRQGANNEWSTRPEQLKQAHDTGSGSDGHVVEILRELTTSVGVSAELQCTLCHDVLCKPVTTPCGHSFCRVCLVEYLLSTEVDESQCPICRGLVLYMTFQNRDADDAAPIFSINVTLWNLIQLLVPVRRDRDPAEEDADYALKYDQFDAKWRIAALQQSVSSARRRWRGDGDDIESSDEELDNADWDPVDDDDAPNQRRREQYPELRQESTIDGHLEVSRNIVLDRDDANEDGYEGMRVSMAIMEFPSLFQPFNEHQECSVVLLKCEEDEDMDSGIPFFTSDEGDDDTLIMSSYYNEVQLRVVDDEGNVVMERTRGCNQGIANFPGLRLDVPAGNYNFQFSDDLYGVNLTIRTELRDLRDEDDSSVDHIGAIRRPLRYVDFVIDQAGERNRSRRRNRQSDDENEEEDSQSDSDDSFIVNDDEGSDREAAQAQFSESEQNGGEWSQSDAEDEEERMERQAQTDMDRRRRGQDRTRIHSSFDSQNSDEASEHESVNVDNDDEPEPDDEDQPSSVSISRSTKRTRIVDDDSDTEDENQAVAEVEEVESNGLSDAGTSTALSSEPARSTGNKRSRAIMESDEDDGGSEEACGTNSSSGSDNHVEGHDEAPRGFSSNKRLRQVTSTLFRDDADDSDDSGGEREANEAEPMRSRWIGGDPYSTRRGLEDSSMDHDGGVMLANSPGARILTGQESDGDSEHHRGRAPSFESDDEDDDHWHAAHAIDDGEEDYGDAESR